jgi:hypothetical protein
MLCMIMAEKLKLSINELAQASMAAIRKCLIVFYDHYFQGGAEIIGLV